MVKVKVPFRFSNVNMDTETFNRFKKYLGAVENFFNGNTIQYLNLRIFTDNNDFKFRIVNNQSKLYRYPINEYIKALLRTYSDGIITTVYFINKIIYYPSRKIFYQTTQRKILKLIMIPTR